MKTVRMKVLENLLMLLGLGLLMASHAIGMPGSANTPDLTENAINPYQASSGELFYKTGSGYFASTLMNTDVDIDVTGLLVKAVVKQTFINQTADWQEALYVFPLPENSAVHAMRIKVGERIIEGEIQEKQQARKTYNQAKAQGKRTALVEQKRPNMFTTEVAHIGPDDTVIIEIEYLQHLVLKDQRVQLRFPTTITPRYNPLPESNEIILEDMDSEALPTTISQGWQPSESAPPQGPVVMASNVPVDSNLLTLSLNVIPGFEIDGLHSLTHSLSGDYSEDSATGGKYTVEFSMGAEKMNRDLVVEWAPVAKNAPQVALFTERRGNDVYGSLLVTPPQKQGSLADSEVLPRELVFVVDTSGSMGGQPIVNAKDVLHTALDGLRTQDQFNIIRFSSDASAFWHRAIAADSGGIARAHSFVDGLYASGGTEMSQALTMALQTQYSADSHLRQIVFITDGSVGNEQALFKQIENNLGDNRLFTVGIGSAPNSYFMRKAAEFGRGSFTYVDDQSQIKTAVGEMLHKIGEPVLRDINIDWQTNDAEMYPPRIPDLYAGDPLAFTFRLKNPGEVITLGITGKQSGYQRFERTFNFEMNNLELNEGEEKKGLDKLWARSKIAYLKDERVRGVDPEKTKAEMLSLALAYGLVSDYTSLVAVDKTPVREPEDVSLTKSDVPALLPKGLTKGMTRYPQTFTGSLTQIMIGIAGLFGVLGFLSCRQVEV